MYRTITLTIVPGRGIVKEPGPWNTNQQIVEAWAEWLRARGYWVEVEKQRGSESDM